MTTTYILIAVLISSVTGNSRPVSIAVEFNSMAACESAKEQVRSAARGADFLLCVKK